NIGFAVTPIIRGPFEAMSRDNSQNTVVLTGLDTDKTKIIQKALIAAELSNLSKRPSVLIVQKKQTSDNIGSTALVTDDELKKIDDKTTFTDMILSRSTKK
ncbi:MAG: transcriptional regulator, partial [Methanomethylophilus sp.]|nr:transcriptional regulator [Methanomethylophilus sp.]